MALAVCPYCESAGSMVMTTACTLNPIYAGLAGPTAVSATIRLPDGVTCLLSCRRCGWRVHGRLNGPQLTGTTLTAGVFEPTEDPQIPPPGA